MRNLIFEKQEKINDFSWSDPYLSCFSHCLGGENQFLLIPWSFSLAPLLLVYEIWPTLKEIWRNILFSCFMLTVRTDKWIQFFWAFFKYKLKLIICHYFNRGVSNEKIMSEKKMLFFIYRVFLEARSKSIWHLPSVILMRQSANIYFITNTYSESGSVYEGSTSARPKPTRSPFTVSKINVLHN